MTILEAKDINNALDGIKVGAFKWYSEGGDTSKDRNSKCEKREGTHYNYERVLGVR